MNFDHSLSIILLVIVNHRSPFSLHFSPHYLFLLLHNPLFILSEIYILLFFVLPLFFFSKALSLEMGNRLMNISN